MKIGILQAGHSPDGMIETMGDYDAMFWRLLDGYDFDFVTYSVVDGAFPPDAAAADGWLITGSKHGVYEDHPWIAPLEKLIREIHSSAKPMIGVCFGHQIIAQALGGKVEKFSGGWSVGHTEYMLDGEPLALNAWHQDQVVAMPQGARVVGRSNFCAHAMLAYGDSIWTIQPHPEFPASFIDGLIRTRGKGVVPKHQLDEATQRLGRPTDSDRIAGYMAQFFKSKERP